MEIPEPVVSVNVADKSPAKRLRHSNWYLTLNTNQEVNEEQIAERSQQFKKALEVLFSPEEIQKFLYSPLGDPIDETTIKKIDTESAIEVGSKNKYLHCHCLFAVSHYTRLRLKYDVIRERFQSLMELPFPPYFYSKCYFDSKANLVEYIRKNAKAITEGDE